MAADRLEKATEELAREQARTTRALEKIAKTLEPKPQVLRRDRYYNAGYKTLLEEIPVDITGVSPALYGLATFVKTDEGRIEIKIQVSGGDADVLEGLIERDFFEKLSIDSVTP